MCIGHHFATTEAVLGCRDALPISFFTGTGSQDSNGSVDDS
jgi:hypothetical protein